MNKFKAFSKNSQNISGVYIVGAGPGDEELLTVKAVRVLQRADIVFYDDLVNSRILGYCKKNVKLEYVGKRCGKKSITQESIQERLIASSKRYKTVVRLKSGDPSVFGRAGEEYLALAKEGISFQIIPGITSAFGAVAEMQIPLTHRDYSSEILFITGHKKDGFDRKAFEGLTCKNKTIVIYMGLSGLCEISKALLENGNSPETMVAIIEDASLPTMRVFCGTIGTLGVIASERRIGTPTLVIIGEIVSIYRRGNQSEMNNLLQGENQNG